MVPGDGAAHPSRDAADPRTTHPAAGGAPSPSSSRPTGTGSGGCSRPRPASQPDRTAAERHQDGVRGQASRVGRGGEGGRRPPDAPRQDGEPSGGRALARMIPRDGDRAPPVENPAKTPQIGPPLPAGRLPSLAENHPGGAQNCGGLLRFCGPSRKWELRRMALCIRPLPS